jgi:hypothetical protein
MALCRKTTTPEIAAELLRARADIDATAVFGDEPPGPALNWEEVSRRAEWAGKAARA